MCQAHIRPEIMILPRRWSAGMEQLLNNMKEYAIVLEEIRVAMESVGAAYGENRVEIKHI